MQSLDGASEANSKVLKLKRAPVLLSPHLRAQLDLQQVARSILESQCSLVNRRALWTSRTFLTWPMPPQAQPIMSLPASQRQTAPWCSVVVLQLVAHALKVQAKRISWLLVQPSPFSEVRVNSLQAEPLTRRWPTLAWITTSQRCAWVLPLQKPLETERPVALMAKTEATVITIVEEADQGRSKTRNQWKTTMTTILKSLQTRKRTHSAAISDLCDVIGPSIKQFMSFPVLNDCINLQAGRLVLIPLTSTSTK